MPPTKKPAVKMNLNAFHKGHSAEGEGDLPLGPSGAPDERGPGGRWGDEERPPRGDRGDRPSRDDEGPSRADGDGEWRQSGGRRGGFRSGGGGDFGDRREGGFRSGGDREGGFRSGGGDREGGFRSGGDREGGFRSGGGDRESGFRSGGGDREGGGFRSGGGDREGGFRSGGGGDREGGFRSGGGDREGGFRSGGGDRADREGGFRSGGGGDREGGFRSGGGDREGGFRSGGGDREGGFRSGERSGFGGRGGFDREGGDRWRGGREEGGDRREGGFGGDRREGGGFRGSDRRGGSGFSDRRGESGDVRASGDVRSSEGYKPLQLKKKGEAVDGPVEPARRSDIFSGPPSRDRDPLPRETRGDARGGDAVVIHSSKPTRGEREDSDSTPASKPARSPREEAAKPEIVEKSVLKTALESRHTINADDLAAGLENLDLNADNRTQFSEMLAKSLFENKLTLKEAVDILEAKLPDASAALIGALQFLKSKKGEATILGMIAHSKLNILDIIAKGKSSAALEQLLTDSSLLCLKPVSALDEHVIKILTEGKQSPEAVLEYINKNTESKQSISSLAGPIGSRLGQVAFQDPAKPDLEAVTQFSKLLKRAVAQPKLDARAMAAVLYALQQAWSDAKMPKGSLKPVFEKLYQTKLITWEGFDAWREDRENKTPNKPKALIQVNSFLDSIKPKEAEEEDEGDDEGDDQEEQ